MAMACFPCAKGRSFFVLEESLLVRIEYYFDPSEKRRVKLSLLESSLKLLQVKHVLLELSPKPESHSHSV